MLDLNEVVTGLATLLRRLIREDIELVLRPGPGLGRVKADPGQLEQVVTNLAVNARDAMPNGGRLTLEMANVDLDDTFAGENPGARVGRYVMLAVSDTGVGFDEETRSRIFEPFFTTKEVGKGTGLGLAMVYGVVKQHEGYITLESARDEGATFRIYLPLVEDPARAGGPGAGLPSAERGSATVLLVEDQDDVRDVAAEILEVAGYTVLPAGTPGEALIIAQKHAGPIDLLVTDVIMPQMNGRELAERLSTIRPDMKVLYISGYADDAIIRHGVLGFGIPMVSKPFSPDALARKVREVLGAS